MKSPSGGVLIIAAGIFGLGFIAAPDARVVEKHSVDVVRVPKVEIRTETKTETVVKPVSPACTKAFALLDDIRSLDKEIESATQDMLNVITEAHQVVVTGSPTELVPITERMTALKQDASNASIEKAELLRRYDSAATDCEVIDSKPDTD